MTGTTPPGEGEQTQPMAAPPWLRKAPARDEGGRDLGDRDLGDRDLGGRDLEGRDLGGRAAGGPAVDGLAVGGLAAGEPAVGGLAVSGPYADMDTIDEPDAATLAARAGSGPSRDAAAQDPPGAGRAAPGVPGTGGLRPGVPGTGGLRPGVPGTGGLRPGVPGTGGLRPGVPGTGGLRPGVPGTGGLRPAAPPPPTSGGSVFAWLWGEQGQAGEYLLASRSVTVGRGPGSDIVLHDRTVSREHARFEYDGSQWWLLPVGSAGPTWVNGQPLAPGQRLPVTDGDRLRFGFHTQLRLLVPGARG
jgi:hypothetical protein